MTIPSCFNYNVNSTGSFTKSILGVNTTVTWEILQKQTATSTITATTPSGTAQVAAGPALAERLQVEYTFNPPLPFVPNTIMFTVNNTTSLPDVFALNYASKSTNSILVPRAKLIFESTSKPTEYRPCSIRLRLAASILASWESVLASIFFW